MGDEAVEQHPVILSFAWELLSDLKNGPLGATAQLPGAQQVTAESRMACGSVISMILTTLLRRSPIVYIPDMLFDGDGEPPEIPLSDYIERALVYTRASREALVLSLANLDNFLCFTGKKCLRPTTVHRLLFVSLVVCAKLVDDAWCTNRYYARVAGVDTDELNALEREFLSTINFTLCYERDVFDTYSHVIDSLALWSRLQSSYEPSRTGEERAVAASVAGAC